MCISICMYILVPYSTCIPLHSAFGGKAYRRIDSRKKKKNSSTLLQQGSVATVQLARPPLEKSDPLSAKKDVHGDHWPAGYPA